LKKRIWEQLDPAGEIPAARSGHSVVRYLDYMLLFGGIYEITKELNDLYAYDLVSGKWNILFEDDGQISSKASD